MSGIGIGLGPGFGSASRRFVPTLVGGTILWLRGDQGITLASSVLSNWTDQSGSGNDASQSTSGFRPPVSTADSTFNGHDVVGPFDAVDDYLAVNGVASSFSGVAKPFTIFVVGSQPTAATREFFCVNKASTFHQYIILRPRVSGTGTFLVDRKTDADVEIVVNGGAPSTTPHVFEALYDGTTLSAFIDGTSVGTPAASSGTCTFDIASIGCNRQSGTPASFFGGKIAEMVIYNSAVSTADRLRVRHYLGSRYAIAVV